MGGRRRLTRHGLLALMVLAGCDRTPEVRAPAPETEPHVDVPSLPPAYLSAPVVYDLGAILEALESSFPRTFGDLDERMDHPENDRVEVSFLVERSPFQAEIQGDTARITAILTYRGRAWYDPPVLPSVSASCGIDDGEPPRATVTLVSPLSLDGEWVLRSRARVESVEAVSEAERDRCRITPLNIDVTGTALGAVRSTLERRTDEIDERVAGVDVRSRLQEVWHTLETPIELTDEVWLLVNPRGVMRGRTAGNGTVLTIEVSMEAFPAIILGDRPDEVHTDLPTLESGEVDDGAVIHLEGRAEYPATGRLLTRELQERELEMSGRLIRIREVALRGVGAGRVALEVEFTGTARGRIFLVGTPEVDHQRGEIHVPDLDFDIETRNVLVGGLAWLGQDALVEFLRERARIPVDQVMGPAREQLLRGMNRELSDEVRVEGEVISTRLLRVVAVGEALHVQAEAEARATFHVDHGSND